MHLVASVRSVDPLVCLVDPLLPILLYLLSNTLIRPKIGWDQWGWVKEV